MSASERLARAIRLVERVREVAIVVRQLEKDALEELIDARNAAHQEHREGVTHGPAAAGQ